MPIFIAATAKSALLIGATIGFAAAVISNDRVIEIAAETLQKGADRLNEHLMKKRNRVANSVAIGGHMPYVDHAMESEATTPSVSEDEFDNSGDETELEFEEATSSGYEKRSNDGLSIHSLD